MFITCFRLRGDLGFGIFRVLTGFWSVCSSQRMRPAQAAGDLEPADHAHKFKILRQRTPLLTWLKSDLQQHE